MTAPKKTSRRLLISCFLVLALTVTGCMPRTDDDNDDDDDFEEDSRGATVHLLA